MTGYTFEETSGSWLDSGGYRWRVDPVSGAWQMETGIPRRWETVEAPAGLQAAHQARLAGQAGGAPPDPAPRCQGRTRAGRGCRAQPAGGSPYCHQHGPDDDQDTGPDKAEPLSQATQLVELAREDYRFAVATTGEPFAVARDGPYLARMLRGGGDSLRAELAAAYAEREGRAPSSSALADAMLVLEGLAMRAERVPLALRLAAYEHGRVAVDLGDPDGRAIILGTPVGWELAGCAPCIFRRTEATGAFPVPERDGTLDPLRELLNVTDETWPLLLAWLVAAFIPDIPHPIVALAGEQGTAKTTATRRLVALTDPSPAPLRTTPRDVEQWVTAAAGSWVVALDNVSEIKEWLSDALCRAVTGDGFVKRRLYSDNALVVLSYRRVVVLNGIDLGEARGDLADRLLPVELERIPPERRLDDADAEQAFTAVWPAVFGALLDLVADVLGILPEVRVERPPRMADFARVVAAVDKLRGTQALDTYRTLTTRVQADVVDADLVARAVRDFTAGRDGPWQGTAGALLDLLTPERPPKGWPETPQGMAAALRRSAPPLRAAGVEVTYQGRKGGGHAPPRTWVLEMTRETMTPMTPRHHDGQTPSSDGAPADGDVGDTLFGPSLEEAPPYPPDDPGRWPR